MEKAACRGSEKREWSYGYAWFDGLTSGLNIFDMNVYNWSGFKALMIAILLSSVN